jgi:DNA repair exonuclease SbcCD ATPase subunit
VVEEIRKTFNKYVNELYRKLGFKDFEDIEIAPDFRVTVTRKKGGKIVEKFPLAALSASERITIAIAFLLSAKNEYVRDLPFFVLDEIITSYDPKRFDIIKEYLKQSNDYVIITELATDIEDIEVVHEA